MHKVVCLSLISGTSDIFQRLGNVGTSICRWSTVFSYELQLIVGPALVRDSENVDFVSD